MEKKKNDYGRYVTDVYKPPISEKKRQEIISIKKELEKKELRS
jgi:hypothetical protein